MANLGLLPILWLSSLTELGSVKKMRFLKIQTRTTGEAWGKFIEFAWELKESKEGIVLCEPSSSQTAEPTVEFTGWAVIECPSEKPRINRADLVGNAEIRLKRGRYVDEVLHGELDHLIGTKLHYTYHSRLREWSAEHNSQESFDQVGRIVSQLKDSPTTRRAQAIIWSPFIDAYAQDAPCLQRIQCLVREGVLNMFTFWRSRDLFGAWGANTYAMVELQRYIADQVGVPIGFYSDFSSSLHIYERSIKMVDEIMTTVRKRGGWE